MSLAADLALQRDVIATRLPDVIALTTVLAAFYRRSSRPLTWFTPLAHWRSSSSSW
jgi:hypothetical protein